jgi:hypothetical protein
MSAYVPSRNLASPITLMSIFNTAEPFSYEMWSLFRVGMSAQLGKGEGKDTNKVCATSFSCLQHMCTG